MNEYSTNENMEHLPKLIYDLALILVLAGAVTLIFKRLKQPLVLGYVVAGFLAGPHMPYTPTVSDTGSIETWASIGVIFLMFTMGIEFSFKKILKMGSGPVIAAITIIFSMSMLGSLAGHAFGWSRMDSLFLGGMLAMSSTTIIYKAVDDLGLRGQRFSSQVLSVLVLEDILGILLMVILSTIAVSKEFEGITVIDSLLKLLFYLALLFLVGVFVVPLLLRKYRKWIGKETLLVVSVGMCFAMVVLAVKLGYSAAFGAFMMGSIFAETVEADAIERLVDPVKNLFGAVFFVSVGMLVDPNVLAQYWLPILVIIVTILLGQAIFGTLGFILSGQTLKVAMQCGFSMAQIGEFAFIIASLGLSLGVTGSFLYPIVVAVSVITTFLTPYMIRSAPAAYEYVSARLPQNITRLLEKQTSATAGAATENNWKHLLTALAKQVLSYSTLCIAVTAISLSFLLPFFRHTLTHWIGNAVCGIITILLLSPFLRAIVMRKNHSEEYKALWRVRHNRPLLALTVIARYLLASFITYYIINYLSPYSSILHFGIAILLVALMIYSRKVKKYSILLEHTFMENLRSRDMQAETLGHIKPLYADHLLSREIHLSILEVPENTAWAGKTLKELDFSRRYGIMVSSILRGGIRHNIPTADMPIYPGDKLEIIASDEQLKQFAGTMAKAVESIDLHPEQHVTQLKYIIIGKESPLCGKTIRESNIRETYRCMIVGFEEGRKSLGLPTASRRFKENDIVWVVGEKEPLGRLLKDNGRNE